MGMFGELSYGTLRPNFIGTPVEDLKLANEQLSQQYRTNKESANQLEIMVSNLELLQQDNGHKWAALDNMEASIKGTVDKNDWEYAAATVSTAAKNFATDKNIKGAMYEKALSDQFDVTNEEGIKAGTINRGDYNKAKKANSAMYKGVQVDKDGNIISDHWGEIDVAPYMDFIDACDKLGKDWASDKTPISFTNSKGQSAEAYISGGQVAMRSANSDYWEYIDMESVSSEDLYSFYSTVFKNDPKAQQYINMQRQFANYDTFGHSDLSKVDMNAGNVNTPGKTNRQVLLENTMQLVASASGGNMEYDTDDYGNGKLYVPKTEIVNDGVTAGERYVLDAEGKAIWVEADATKSYGYNTVDLNSNINDQEIMKAFNQYYSEEYVQPYATSFTKKYDFTKLDRNFLKKESDLIRLKASLDDENNRKQWERTNPQTALPLGTPSAEGSRDPKAIPSDIWDNMEWKEQYAAITRGEYKDAASSYKPIDVADDVKVVSDLEKRMANGETLSNKDQQILATSKQNILYADAYANQTNQAVVSRIWSDPVNTFKQRLKDGKIDLDAMFVTANVTGKGGRTNDQTYAALIGGRYDEVSDDAIMKFLGDFTYGASTSGKGKQLNMVYGSSLYSTNGESLINVNSNYSTSKIDFANNVNSGKVVNDPNFKGDGYYIYNSNIVFANPTLQKNFDANNRTIALSSLNTMVGPNAGKTQIIGGNAVVTAADGTVTTFRSDGTYTQTYSKTSNSKSWNTDKEGVTYNSSTGLYEKKGTYTTEYGGGRGNKGGFSFNISGDYYDMTTTNPAQTEQWQLANLTVAAAGGTSQNIESAMNYNTGQFLMMSGAIEEMQVNGVNTWSKPKNEYGQEEDRYGAGGGYTVASLIAGNNQNNSTAAVDQWMNNGGIGTHRSVGKEKPYTAYKETDAKGNTTGRYVMEYQGQQGATKVFAADGRALDAVIISYQTNGLK